MNDQEYLKLWREAVAAFLLAPKIHKAGLCYGLTRAGQDRSSEDFYEWLYSFIGYHRSGYIGHPGVLSPLRQTVVLLMAELDDETILYIRDNKSCKHGA